MSDQHADIARRAATRLVTDFGFDRTLPALTERVIQEGSDTCDPATYDPNTLISLGILLVGLCNFAWNVYWKVREQQEAKEDDRKPAIRPNKAALARTLRVQLDAEEDGPDLTPEQRAKIADVVAEETIASDADVAS